MLPVLLAAFYSFSIYLALFYPLLHLLGEFHPPPFLFCFPVIVQKIVFSVFHYIFISELFLFIFLIISLEKDYTKSNLKKKKTVFNLCLSV